MQVQQQLEAQQAQHAAQTEDMGSKAAQMESLIRQATELDQQHVTELNARETDLDELRQVSLCMSSLQLASCDAASSYSVNDKFTFLLFCFNKHNKEGYEDCKKDYV